jgi:dTDP-4-amino-4,6-dideoxygalactose transaminase
MREIQMVDLRAQYDKMGSEIDYAIKSVLLSTAFIKGPDVKLFEEELQEYMHVKNVVSCANGTDALQLAITILGLKPGDEVITTNFTFIATIEVVALLGLKPVIVDPEPGTFNISVEAVRKAFIFLVNALTWKALWSLLKNMAFLSSKMLHRQQELIISLRTEPPKKQEP